MLTLGILRGHVFHYIWAEPAEWPTRPQPHSSTPYCVTQTELGFCYFWIYFIHTCMMQPKRSFFMPKKNLYFWIKMEWWWFYYFHCNNHYCHNSEPLSPCKVPGTQFTCVTLFNGLEQNYFSKTFITGPILRCLCGAAWSPDTHLCTAQALLLELRATGAFLPMQTCGHLSMPQLGIQDHNI